MLFEPGFDSCGIFALEPRLFKKWQAYGKTKQILMIANELQRLINLLENGIN